MAGQTVRTIVSAEARQASAHGAYGGSVIYAIKGYTCGETILPECNTNLMHTRTVLPMLHAAIEPGVHELVCAAYCASGDEMPEGIQQEVLDAVQ